MAENTTAESRDLLTLITGYWNTQALRVSARLGIADLLSHGPMTCPELAAATNADPASLGRLLNFLRGIRIVDVNESSAFSLTSLGELMRRDAVGSMHELAILYGEEFYNAWGELLVQVSSGTYAFENVHGTDMFGYFAVHPEIGRRFDIAMKAGRSFLAAVRDVHDFSAMRRVVDVAGGGGTLLASILQKYPAISGVLFDRTPVLDAARPFLEEQGLSERCAFVAGDFFDGVPQGGDCYILSRILHDWDDDNCLRILRNCYDASALQGDLIIVERVLPPDGDAIPRTSLALAYDLHMAVVAGGRERTEASYRSLLSASGFDFQTTHALPMDVYAIVAKRRHA
ncbi:methyltransferase [Agrobacterium rosae]|uniref:Multifunctional cyclase-dehydratase-3-O-methyl transferase TcmN n=1 Tax=Agrobacterium rosae TaxID=1972867 RepID=A0A1R3U2V0_9HYPH|nr:methyltransferase [Agrobacterium rosae]SCX35911.1 Multifunctional cyclase-dehydratase-3-O-methyl transferase TcmN [Agrobacterium rosae]